MGPDVIMKSVMVGLITVLVGMIVSTPPMYIGKPATQHPSAGTLASVAGALFVTGALVHGGLMTFGDTGMYCARDTARPRS
jgi:hypothetical protein